MLQCIAIIEESSIRALQIMKYCLPQMISEQSRIRLLLSLLFLLRFILGKHNHARKATGFCDENAWGGCREGRVGIIGDDSWREKEHNG